MKRALVCGAGGFIGGHRSAELTTKPGEEAQKRGVLGPWRGHQGAPVPGPGTGHEFAPTAAGEFLLLDLREPQNCRAALTLDGHPSTSSGQAFDKVYQLPADMEGGSEWRLLSES